MRPTTDAFLLLALLASFALLLGPSEARAHGAAADRIAALGEELARFPDDPRRLFERADLLVEHGDHTLARTDLDRIDRLAPDQFPTGYVRARLLSDEGRPAEALARLEQAGPRFASDPRLLLLRARLRREVAGAAAAAPGYLAAWNSLQPRRADVALEAAEVLEQAELSDGAEAVLREGIEHAGRVPSLLIALIDLLSRRGRPADAVPWAEAMEQRAARPEPWIARRAELLEQAGRADEAAAVWRALAERLARLPNLERGSPALAAVREKLARRSAEPAPHSLSTPPR